MAPIAPDNGSPERNGTETDSGAREAPAAGRRRLSVVSRLAVIAILGVVIAGVLAVAIGFWHFVGAVAALERPLTDERADAIALLGEGRARRLLISGVHPGTTRETLANMTPNHDDLFFCCVDLGHSALNTVGNAKEARDWARGNGFTSLIVVTSSYHLPRSLNEISREMPEADLIPYPVVTGRVHIDNWWRNPGTTRLLLAEYGKYLMSMARLRLGGPATSMEAAHAAIGD